MTLGDMMKSAGTIWEARAAGSPVLVRDISNQEIYALDWQLP
jgi:hypothetical protein